MSDNISFAVSSDGMSLTASGTAFIKTPFLQLANIAKLPLISNGQQPIAQAQLAVGGNGGQSLEVAMMLDITGSMAGQKLTDLQTSATDLINILVWTDQSQYTSKVSIVPFTEDIRLPTTTAINAARGTNLPTIERRSAGQPTTCRTAWWNARARRNIRDAAPATGQYVMGHYTSNNTTVNGNKKGVCVVQSPVLPLTSDKTSLLAAVNGLTAGGGTAGHLGTAWAWYTLSPNWASLWPSASQPAAYGTANLQKIAILMTDGDYNTQYNSSGIGVDQNYVGSCPDAANGCSGAQALSQCAAMKAAGITIYTVGFTIPSSDTTAINLLTQCASDPSMFYSAADGTQLQQAFRDIAIKLSSLYLIEVSTHRLDKPHAPLRDHKIELYALEGLCSGSGFQLVCSSQVLAF